MKIVLTGATGLIGGCALESALAHPEITHVVSLQHRLLGPERAGWAANKKLEQVIVEDWLRYDAAVLDRIRGAEACIWCMGNFKDYRTVGRDEVFKVNKDYPAAFLRQAALPTAKAAGTRFRFVFIGGIIMSRDQDANLWLASGMRKESGLVLQNAFDIAAAHPQHLQALLQHPGYVFRPAEHPLLARLPALGWFLRGEYVGAVLVEMALRGTQRSEGEDEVWNSTTIRWGMKLVAEGRGT